MDPLVSFLKEGLLPDDKSEAEKICRKAPRYWLSEEQKLYKCFHSGLYLLCVQLHEGICGSHIGRRSLSHRGVLVAKYTKSCPRVCSEVRSVLKIRSKYPSTGRGFESTH